MPLTIKENASGTSGFSSAVITAEDYMLHDQEIRAIEEYLGLTGGGIVAGTSSDDGSQPPNTQHEDLRKKETAALIATLVSATDQLNVFVGEGGLQTSSGYLISGQQILFPENAHYAFLKSNPSVESDTIEVDSTIGFPSAGVISILNDIDQVVESTTAGQFSEAFPGSTMVEWIRYGGKTPTSFLNCQRGYLGTFPGTHAGNLQPPRPAQASIPANLKDFCVLVPSGFTLCTRRFNAARYRTVYKIAGLRLTGTPKTLEAYFKRNASSLNIDFVGNEGLLAAADDVGILQTNGTQHKLVSQDTTAQSKGQLTGDEAADFVDAIIDNLSAALIASPDSIASNIGSIPVFQGRMSVQYGLSNISRSSTAKIEAIEILQNADGTAYAFVTNRRNKDHTLHGVVSYQTFFVMSGVTRAEFDRWETTRNLLG